MIEAILNEEPKQTTGPAASAPVVSVAKMPIYSRYFIELHVPENREASRIVVNEARSDASHQFIQVLRDWIKNDNLSSELSSVSVTAMGQVMIVCSHRLIDLIRDQDIWAISHIRSAELSSDLRRISGKV